jgi:hypothetical protein
MQESLPGKALLPACIAGHLSTTTTTPPELGGECSCSVILPNSIGLQYGMANKWLPTASAAAASAVATQPDTMRASAQPAA